MSHIINTLICRDGMAEADAIRYANTEMMKVNAMLSVGRYADAVEYFSGVFGVSPDYIKEAVYGY